MSRKKRVQSANKPSDSPSLEATTKKLQSLLVSPNWPGFMRGGTAKGVREKLLKIDFQTIRNLVDRVPLLSAIINVRVEQVKAFSKYVKPKEPGKGYEFYCSDPSVTASKKDLKVFYKLSEFLSQTGVNYDSLREDDFADYLEMVTRETLTIDQIGTEIQRNRAGEVMAFWLLDGATLKRLDPKDYEAENKDLHITKDTRFCQMVDQKLMNVYTDEDLIFDYKNKRADIRYRGFGYSPVEQCVDIITTLLFGYNYARDQLMRDRVPKGFIQVMGDVGSEQLDAIREYWYSAMSGAGGQWNIPIVPSGKDGVGIDWKNIQASNRDMEYHKLMMFLTSIISAVFNIDTAELGIKTDDSAPIMGERSADRIQASKDRGLMGILSFIEQHVNKILRKVTTDFKFRFTGIEIEDEGALADLRKKEVETRMTINELREQDGLEPLEDDYANVVLNPQSVQIYMSDKNAAAQKEQQDAEGGDEGYGDEGEGFPDGSEGAMQDEGDGSEGTEVDWQDDFAKSMKSPKKTIRVTIE